MSGARARPRVTMAWAQGIDGSIAARPGERLAISSEASKRRTHALRAAHDAILVGAGTVIADDPHLGARLAGGPHPRPIVLDGRLMCPPASTLVRREDTRPLVRYAEKAASLEGFEARKDALIAAGAELAAIDIPSADHQREMRLPIDSVLRELAARGFGSLMVEGGAMVLDAFARARAADRMEITVAPRVIGGYRPFSGIRFELRVESIEPCGGDLWIAAIPIWHES